MSRETPLEANIFSELCVIVKDEEASIVEWLAYHHLLGFDRITVYDNGSTDRTGERVRQVADQLNTIRIVDWPDVAGQRPQVSAYKDAVQRSSAEWIAFFDVDEFLCLKQAASINAFLGEFAEGVSGVAINWRIFGSGGALEEEEGLVIDRFLWAANTQHPKNRFCKSILRVEDIETVGIHTSRLSKGDYADSEGRIISMTESAKTPAINFRGAQLNHYLLKSWEEFTKKRARGDANQPVGAADRFSHRGSLSQRPKKGAFATVENEYWVSHDLNEEMDTFITGYSAKVKALIDSLAAA